jgi:4-hydroxy-2-oxoglutarate aldolase
MDKSAVSLSGVFPPLPTPFDAGGDLALGALVENLERWNACGLAGYVVLGSNGEAGYLSEDERVRVWETAREVIPPEKVMLAGTGCESTRATIALTRRAAEAGADAALVVTPNYYDSKMTPDALLAHYRAVADASPIPVVLYNVPKFTHVELDMDTIARAARHPNVVGLKDSGGDIARLTEVVRLTGPAAETGFQVMAGTAGYFLTGLLMGAVGGVLAVANVAPAESVELYRLFEAGRWDEAVALQRRLIPVNTAVTGRFGIAGLKAALDMLGYYGGPVRSPLQPVGEDERRALRGVLVEGGLL